MKITVARTPKAALRGSEHVLVIAPNAALRKPQRLSEVMGRTLTRLANDLAAEVKASSAPALASTLTRGKPPRLTVCALPDKLSHYNSPTRADAICKGIRQAKLPERKKSTIVLLLDAADHALAAINAVGRALPRYRNAATRPDTGRIEVVTVGPDGKVLVPSAALMATVRAARDCAELVDMPPNELTPETFALQARARLSELGERVTIEETIGDALVDADLAGIHGVGRCSAVAPRLLVAHYNGSTSHLHPHIALVGKGVTYDTGGLSLKTPAGLCTMKCDMGGAAAALGAFHALVTAETKHELSLVLCLVENAIGPSALKPDDILTMHSKKTVEVNNTDAEGRLLLADGVSYASRELKADVIFDAATLTGAQVMSTGLLHAAVISNDLELERHVVETGRACGDLVHPLPFAPELFQREFRSEVADMRNSVKNRMNAQTSCAAQFIYAHLGRPTQVRWCHIDLAGPAFPSGRATGYGVALLTESIRSLP